MIYPIVVYGSPILRKKAEEIDKKYPDLQKLIEDMYETMHVSDGVGLAAPQIGKSIRLFVVDADPMKEDDPELAGFKKVFINPQITDETGNEWPFNEGCLSLPKLREEVIRKEKISIKYYDESFVFKDEVYDGIKARIIQHEYDHLDGILFIDRVKPLKKKLLKGKLNDIAKGKVDAGYRIKVLK